MALTITVNGAGTFTASMEEGPVSFSASLGAIGPKGDTGATGATGPGVAAGGTTGQILVKTTNADYATGWIDNAARSVFISGRNNTGSTIAKGAVVYLSGATGNKATIALAQANGEATSARTIGITKAEVANGADVDVVISGAIENINTSAFSAGQVVYLSATVAGGLTTTLPTQPNHGVVVGIVTRSNANNGSIEVTVQNYQELKELSDVLVSNPQNGQVLTYDSGLWKNLSIPAPDLSAYLTSATAAATYQTIAGMSSYLTTSAAASTYAPIVHTHTASQISDSTSAGRALLTAADAAAQRTNLGLGTMATATATDYLSKAGNLSGLADLPTSRTNIGLGAEDSVSFAQITYSSATAPSLRYGIFPNDIWAGVYDGIDITRTRLSNLGVTFPDATVQATKGLLPASNLSDLASASTARTNLGLGTMAVESASSYYLASNPAGYVTAATAPVTSVAGKTGAVSLAVADVSGAAPLASPTFTGTPSLPTGTIAVTQAAGNNTTAVATTAFVQQEVPAASTTAAGKVELADDSEARAATATNRAVTPAVIPWLMSRPNLRYIGATAASSVSGSGQVTITPANFGREIFIGSLATGRGAYTHGVTNVANRGFFQNRAYMNRLDFSKKIWLSGTCSMGYNVGATSYLGDSNTVARAILGGDGEASTADLTIKGFGIKKVGGVSSYVTLTVHDGTNLTDVATTYQNAADENFEWLIYSDGTGNVTLWINGSQAATTSAGPTGLGTALRANYWEQVYAASTPAVRHAMQSTGGILYFE